MFDGGQLVNELLCDQLINILCAKLRSMVTKSHKICNFRLT